jgi:mRNA interferase MazF
MVIERGDIWWASLPSPAGAGPGYDRPVLVVQSDAFNRSRIQTVMVAIITSNVQRANSPGNVLIPRKASGLLRPSVVNVSQIMSLDRSFLRKKVKQLAAAEMREVDAGLRLVFSL